MAAGDYVIRGNASNTDEIPGVGSDLLLDWPTAIANVGSGITHSSGTFSLGETGHFLVMCSDHSHSVDNTNNERIAYKMTLTLDATELVEGYSTAYIRKNDTALLDYLTFSAAIINVVSTTGTGDELEVRCERVDDVTITGPVRVVDDRVGITIIKLDDSWGYGRYQSSSARASSTTDNARVVMNIQTQDEQDSPFTRSTDTIDIATGNLVLAVYSVKCEVGSGRSTFHSNLFLNGSALDGSWNHNYNRNNQATDWSGTSNVVLLNPTSGWDLDVGIVTRESGDNPFDVAIQLVELPAGAEAIILESAAGDYNPTSAANFNWPNAPAYEDTAAFTFSEPATNIDVDNAGDYIVTAAMANATDAGSGVTRGMPALQFRVNTTDVEHAGHTTYNRNTGTADHSGLSCATLLTGLSADDSIHCRVEAFGNTGTITNTAAQFAVIRLSSLFAAGAIDATPDLQFAATTADLEAKGKLDATPDVVLDIPTTDLKAKGKLDASAALVFAIPVADLVNGAGAISASPSFVFASAAADLEALGKLDGSPDIVLAVPTVDLEGTGKLDAIPDIVFALASADLNATGKLDATPDIVFGVPTANLIDQSGGPGPISASPTMVFASSVVDLKGTGKLDASPSDVMIFAAVSADLKAQGKLGGSATLIFGAPSASLDAKGKLDGSAALQFGAPTRTLIGRGKLDGAPVLIWSVSSADLKGTGALLATPDLVLSVPTVNLGGRGTLSAMPPLLFAVPLATIFDATGTPFYHLEVTAAVRKITITAVAGQIN